MSLNLWGPLMSLGAQRKGCEASSPEARWLWYQNTSGKELTSWGGLGGPQDMELETRGVQVNLISIFRRRRVPRWIWVTYIHLYYSNLCSKVFTFMNWLQPVFPREQTSFPHSGQSLLSYIYVFRVLPVTPRARGRSRGWMRWLMQDGGFAIRVQEKIKGARLTRMRPFFL